MKYFIIVFWLLLMFGCQWLNPKIEPKTPEEALITFLESLKKRDFATAKLHASPNTKLFLDIIENPNSVGINQTSEQAQQENLGELMRIKAVKCVVSADTALCAACLETKHCVNPSAFVAMQRIKGHWLVVLM